MNGLWRGLAPFEAPKTIADAVAVKACDHAHALTVDLVVDGDGDVNGL